jgi:phosphoribosylaminoimidazolecarboxamide formyltransferase/IMP cyclohydrolase
LKKIRSALISVYNKNQELDSLLSVLHDNQVKILSTGGTLAYIQSKGYSATAVEDITAFPSILDGRVKTLHPAVFGGILARRDHAEDLRELEQFHIDTIDLVIVDLYPFEETVHNTTDEQAIIEKIDIGGISLIRATAKNYNDTAILCRKDQYIMISNLLINQEGALSLEQRKELAKVAFSTTAHYDTAITTYFDPSLSHSFQVSVPYQQVLRYGENPHQRGWYYGDLDGVFDKLNGKELSYNNLVDIDAGVHLIKEFSAPTFAILKHTNPCGIASRATISEAWDAALAADPISAFGGVLISNKKIDQITAEKIDALFFEVIVAPDYDQEALTLFIKKKNRIILRQKTQNFPSLQYKSLLKGVLVQDFDEKMEDLSDFQAVTEKIPSQDEYSDLIFAVKVVKHLKSNTIVLAKDGQMLGMGCGQTSRVDALRQAIHKAKSFGFDLQGAVMASDAFFPFPDCVEIAHHEGITAVSQPGGSVKDSLSIDYCNQHGVAMVFTGVRHFKH